MHSSPTGQGIRLASLATAGLLTLAAPPAQAATAFVRVNQVGYDAAASKRAYLLADAAETGATFSVKNAGGATVLVAGVGANLGSWNNTYRFVYALDFGSVTAPGTYTITVTGPVVAGSPSFKLDSPANLYTFLLANAVFFYQSQRDGPNVVPTVMSRQPAHLNDQSATVYDIPSYTKNGRLKGDLVPVSGAAPRDASGGWFDAGDYIKGVQTASYTADLLLIAVRDHPSLLGQGSPSGLFDEARFGLDWLRKMWDDGTSTLYYQVMIGDGNSGITGDHDLWRPPERDDTWDPANNAARYIRHRPLFRAGPPGSSISPNLAGRMAAAFALGYQVYKGSDLAYANGCLLRAQHVFDLANTAPAGRLLTFSPFDFYPETEWSSDLELAAAELYLAVAAGGLPPGLPHTDPLFYLQKAAHWANAYITGPFDATDTLNLYDVSALAHYEVHRAITQAGNPAGLEVTPAALVADVKKQLDKAGAQAAGDPFGLGFAYSQFDLVSHSQGLAITASLYDELTGTLAYADFGRRQLGVIVGANAWGTSFIVGAGSTFPHCMQHQVANLSGSLDGSPPVVKGAAVNGPNGPQTGLGTPSGANACPADGVDRFAAFNGHGGQFLDDVRSWPTVEPALDFVASTPLAFARHIDGKP